jgi:hypothetical protein
MNEKKKVALVVNTFQTCTPLVALFLHCWVQVHRVTHHISTILVVQRKKEQRGSLINSETLSQQGEDGLHKQQTTNNKQGVW